MRQRSAPRSKAPAEAHRPEPVLTRFIGRQKEMAEVLRLLTPGLARQAGEGDARLLTLTGAGGCGKTRLAMRLAEELTAQHAFADGVCWVALDSVFDAALVLPKVSDALHMREAANEPLLQSLTAYLAGRQFLLVLDNCEHLLGACAELAKHLLRAAPALHILATSREPLGVAGESSWLVPSLTLPPVESQAAGRRFSVRDLGKYDAVQLFLARATAVQPAFTLTAQNAHTMLNICQRLDGMPLAIELAAARVNVLSLEQIAARLDDAFQLLTAGNRTAVIPRHRTLRATLDWSYDLLLPQEQALFRRLAVFAGGWTLEAAEEVCVVNVETPRRGVSTNVLEVLLRLVDKSLVSADTLHKAEACYRLLETTRAYALEKLIGAGEEPALRRRHRDWLLRFAQRADLELRSPAQATGLKRLEREQANWRAALAWSAPTADEAAAGLSLALALAWFWNVRGDWSEGRRWLERLLTVSADRAPQAQRAHALYWAGIFASAQRDYAAAGSLHRQSLSIARAVADAAGIARGLDGLASLAGAQGDFDMARALGEQALAHWKTIGDAWAIVNSLNSLATTLSAQGDHTTARAMLEECLSICERLGDKRGTARTLNNLGDAVRVQGDYERAARLYETSLSLLRELGSNHGIGTVLFNLHYVALRGGDYRHAAALLDDGRAVGGERNRYSAETMAAWASVAALAGQPELAVQLFGYASRLVEVTGNVLVAADQVEVQRYSAKVRAQLGDAAFTRLWQDGRLWTYEQASEQAHRLSAKMRFERAHVVSDDQLEPLHDRELEVLRLMADGRSNREIAERLVVTLSTVKWHSNNLFGKLGVRSRTQAVARARELGVL